MACVLKQGYSWFSLLHQRQHCCRDSKLECRMASRTVIHTHKHLGVHISLTWGGGIFLVPVGILNLGIHFLPPSWISAHVTSWLEVTWRQNDWKSRDWKSKGMTGSDVTNPSWRPELEIHLLMSLKYTRQGLPKIHNYESGPKTSHSCLKNYNQEVWNVTPYLQFFSMDFFYMWQRSGVHRMDEWMRKIIPKFIYQCTG